MIRNFLAYFFGIIAIFCLLILAACVYSWIWDLLDYKLLGKIVWTSFFTFILSAAGGISTVENEPEPASSPEDKAS